MKIDISSNAVLVQVASSENTDNHMIYSINGAGNIIEHFHIKDAEVKEVIELIPHSRIIQFTDKQMWEVNCKCMFNRIWEPDFIPYDMVEAWNLPPELNVIMIHFCDMKNVFNYSSSEDYFEAERTVEHFIYDRQTPIEITSEDIHQQGVKSRTKFLKYIRYFVL